MGWMMSSIGGKPDEVRLTRFGEEMLRPSQKAPMPGVVVSRAVDASEVVDVSRQQGFQSALSEMEFTSPAVRSRSRAAVAGGVGVESGMQIPRQQVVAQGEMGQVPGEKSYSQYEDDYMGRMNRNYEMDRMALASANDGGGAGGQPNARSSSGGKSVKKLPQEIYNEMNKEFSEN
jgi:hypothetical protein